MVRKSAVKARTQTINQIRALMVTAPSALRDRLRGLPTGLLIDTLARTRPAGDLTDRPARPRRHFAASPGATRPFSRRSKRPTRTWLPSWPGRHPASLHCPGVGTETAGQLLITAGDNPDRLRSEASFAHLCGAAPIPASSGRTHRHRINRGGDRNANRFVAREVHRHLRSTSILDTAGSTGARS